MAPACYLMSALAFVKRPHLWLKAISAYKGTHSQAPNFAYERCSQRVQLENHETLDLSGWISAAIGAEPINPRVMQEFYDKFKNYGFSWETFSPGYGLAENTLAVSASPVFEPPVIARFNSEALGHSKVVGSSKNDSLGKVIVGCGRPVHNTEVAIVDPKTRRRCNKDTIGEIWVASHCVATVFGDGQKKEKRRFKLRL